MKEEYILLFFGNPLGSPFMFTSELSIVWFISFFLLKDSQDIVQQRV